MTNVSIVGNEADDRAVQLAQTINKVNSIVSESLGIGIPGEDPTENVTSSQVNYSGTVARNLHRSLDIVSRIIDSPASDAMKNGFEIETNQDELGINKLIQERLDSLDFDKKAFEFIRDTRLYTRGGLIYPIIKEMNMDSHRTHLSRPLFVSTVEKIEALNIIPDEMISFTIQNYDPHAKGFGEIDRLYIQGQQTAQNRIFHFVNGLDIYRQRGVSMLDKIVVACKGLAIAEWTIQNLLLRYRALVVKYPSTEAVSQNPKRQRALKGLLDKIKINFTSKSVASVPNNYEFEYLETKFTGLKEATQFLYEYLASVSHVPQSKIKGSSMGELASAERDERAYYEDVETFEQQGKVRPLLDFIIPFTLWEKKGKIFNRLWNNGINPDSVTWKIKFNPIASTDSLQQAQIDLINAQRDSIEIDKGVVKPEEVRRENHPELEEYVPDGFSETSQFGNMGIQELNKFMETFPLNG
jgi:phage-related protein (TIGR01555 family)